MQHPRIHPAHWTMQVHRWMPQAHRWLSILLLGLCLCLAAPLALAHEHDAPPKQPSLVQITVLQVNDVYQLTPVNHYGGMARLATLVDRIRHENPHTFFVLGGDTLSPSIASRLFQGKQMIDLWNHIGLDVAVLGNHEFDFGPEVLRARMAESQFTWVNSNVRDRLTRKPFGNSVPYLIKEVEGVKIGFFGLLTPDTPALSAVGDDIDFDDPVQSAQRTVRALRRAGADVIVGLTHLAMHEDKTVARTLTHQQLAIIMGGHEHSLLTAMAGGVPIFKVASDARNLGRADFWVDRRTKRIHSMDWTLIPVDSSVPEEPRTAALVAQYETQVQDALGQPVGHTDVALDAVQQTNRSQETNLGNFIADTYRAHTGADVGLINGGGIRTNTTYGPGPVSRRDILAIMPFDNQLMVVEVSGQQLKAALENGVSRLGDEEAGRFPHVSGLSMRYDGRLPAGQRITEILIDGKPLDRQAHYTLATSNYLVGGGDGYTALAGARLLSDPQEAPLEAEVVMEAIRQAGRIAPTVEGRIIRVDAPHY